MFTINISIGISNASCVLFIAWRPAITPAPHRFLDLQAQKPPELRWWLVFFGVSLREGQCQRNIRRIKTPKTWTCSIGNHTPKVCFIGQFQVGSLRICASKKKAFSNGKCFWKGNRHKGKLWKPWKINMEPGKWCFARCCSFSNWVILRFHVD